MRHRSRQPAQLGAKAGVKRRHERCCRLLRSFHSPRSTTERSQAGNEHQFRMSWQAQQTWFCMTVPQYISALLCNRFG